MYPPERWEQVKPYCVKSRQADNCEALSGNSHKQAYPGLTRPNAPADRPVEYCGIHSSAHADIRLLYGHPAVSHCHRKASLNLIPMELPYLPLSKSSIINRHIDRCWQRNRAAHRKGQAPSVPRLSFLREWPLPVHQCACPRPRRQRSAHPAAAGFLFIHHLHCHRLCAG